MEEWKLNIFVNAIKTIIKRESVTAEVAIQRFTKLTTAEKDEILNKFTV